MNIGREAHRTRTEKKKRKEKVKLRMATPLQGHKGGGKERDNGKAEKRAADGKIEE